MSRVLCVWELGSGYGHLGRLLPVALELRERGHDVAFALRELTHSEAFLGKHGFDLMQAPVWMGERRGGDFPINYAEMLGNFGYLYPRAGARYWGPVFAPEEGVSPVWPEGQSERIFASLNPRYRDFEKVMDQLVALPYRSLVHAPRLADKLVKRYRTRNVSISLEPVHIVKASRESDLVICHGGISTSAAALLAGRPLLVLHIQAEQLLLAQGLAQRGFAKTVNAESKNPNYRQMIRDILSDARFAERAQQFAAKYASFDLSSQAGLIATRCEEMLRTADGASDRKA